MKPTYLMPVAALFLAAVIFPSCSGTETEEQLTKSLETKAYIIDDVTYYLTYEWSDEGEFTIDEETEDNAVILEMAMKDSAIIHYDLASNETRIFSNPQEGMTYLIRKRGDVFTPVQSLPKSTTKNVNAKFYQHNNYVNQLFVDNMNKYMSQTNSVQIKNLLSALYYPYHLSGYCRENPWVGSSFNDQISSIRIEKNNNATTPTPWGRFILVLGEDINFGGQGFWFTGSTDMTMPLAIPSLKPYLMWAWIFPYNNWNDETSSYFFGAYPFY